MQSVCWSDVLADRDIRPFTGRQKPISLSQVRGCQFWKMNRKHVPGQISMSSQMT